jgi:proteic killer suppression protein
MIISFSDQISEDIFDDRNSKKTQKRLPAYLHATAKRKLDMINAAFHLKDLEKPPNNRLEKLKGDRAHQHSIRINDQYRIVFTWINGNAEDVEIVDYH